MKMFKILVIVALTALIGLSFVSCDTGGGGPLNEWEEFLSSFNSGTPSTDALTNVGLSSSAWTASGLGNVSGYRGWDFSYGFYNEGYYVERKELLLVYTNQNDSGVTNLLVRVETLTGEDPESGNYSSDADRDDYYFSYEIDGIRYTCGIHYFKRDLIDDTGFITPAGFVAVRLIVY